jgi:hypothetical protein
MFRVLFLSLILIGSVAIVHAEKVNPIPAPTSFIPLDTIRTASDKDIIARFEGLKNELSKDPTARGYIINYGTKSQIQKRERQVRKALVFHKIDPKMVLIASAGSRGYLETIIYLIPASAEVPQPVQSAVKFDEFDKISASQVKKRTENFYKKLIDESVYIGYIINYGSNKEIVSTERIMSSVIGKGCDFDCPRLTIIRGRNLKNQRSVLWIVPPGIEPPKP